jgi:predicted nucleotidyltransferase
MPDPNPDFEAILKTLNEDGLLKHTEEVDLGEGIQVIILNLPTLISMKEQLGRDRDRAVLPILRKTLQERHRTCG